MQVMLMRIQTSMLEPDLRQPKNRLALLARVIGQLIATVDPVQLDRVLFEFLRSELRLDAFFSFERTADNRLQLATCCGTPAMEADVAGRLSRLAPCRSEEHTSELQSLMRISYAVFCLKKKNTDTTITNIH